MRGNNLGPVDKTVSILIDRSYPVVKAVYENLEAIAFLQENSESWKYLYENFDKIEEVSQAAKDVNIVVENLEAILNAKVYGEQAKASAEAAKASETASKTSQDAAKASEDNAKDYSDAAKTYLDQAQEIAQDMSDLGDAIEIVADNIDSVNTDATYINQINMVASDFNGNTTIISMPDWGEVGVEQLLPEVPTGGNIFTVAQNMQHVVVDSENIEFIKKVALGLDDIPEIEATFVGYVNQAQVHVEEAEKARDDARDARAGAEDALNSAIMVSATITNELPKIQAEGAKQVDLVVQKGAEQVNLVSAEGKNQIKAVQTASSQEQTTISNAGTTQVSLVTQEGTKQIGLVQAESTNQVGIVQAEGATQVANVQDAATEAISDVESTKDGVVQAVTDEGTKQTGLVQTEGATQVKAVQDASAAEITKIQQEGSTQIASVASKASEQITLVQQEGTEQTGLVTAEGTKQVTAVQTEGTTQTGLVTAEGTKQIEAVTAKGTEQVNLVQQTGQEQVSLATAQAQIATEKASAATSAEALAQAWASKMDAPVEGQEYSAKYWANQASTGQLQADWLQTDSSSKDFIKNKPILGALASKNSLNYSELVGTPPAQDLTPYLTKEDASNQYLKQATASSTYATKVELSQYLPLAGGTVSGITHFTDTVVVPSPTDSTHAANKAYVDSMVTAVYRVKGSVANKEALPTEDNVVGDVYNASDTGNNFVYTEEGWDQLSGTVDLSNYYTRGEIDSTVSTLTTQIGTKLDASTYTADKATFAIASEVQNKLDTKAEKTHNHLIADITDLQTALDGKQPTGEYRLKSETIGWNEIADLGEVGVD